MLAKNIAFLAKQINALYRLVNNKGGEFKKDVKRRGG